MMEPRLPKYEWGQRVRALSDLVNDGSHPKFPEDALLAAKGHLGEIVNVGMHTELKAPVYMVLFGPDHVVGCFEEEIAPV